MTTKLAALLKEYVSPPSATSGLAAYALEGQRTNGVMAAASVDLRDWLSPTRINRLNRLAAKARGTRIVAKKVTVDTAAHLAAASPFNLKRHPSKRQQSAGNYAKGHVSISGLQVAIENPAGSRRQPQWPELTAHYGYAKRTEGADGDGVDVFVKVGTPTDWKGDVFVVDQVVGGEFDEHKAMIGWATQEAASAAYLSNYEDGWEGLGAITGMPLSEFKAWLKNGDTSAPISKEI